MNKMAGYDGMKKAAIQEYLEREKFEESEFLGIEEEYEEDSEEEYEEDGFPYDVKKIRIEQKMITVFQIEHWIRMGILNLSPEYQRNLVWDHKRKSALIESLMLKIPIPSFYLDENSKGMKSVIDGMQRLSAIHEFMNDAFPLKGMQYLTGCEKKTFSQLDIKFRTYIEDTALSVNILDERCPQKVKFDVFRRVNTGGLPLNYQEIRNIMAAPEVRKLLRDMAGCEEFLLATEGRIKDIRMGAQELCLRYLTVLKCYQWETKKMNQYYGLMKTMDLMILNLNEMSDAEYRIILEQFKSVMLQCHKILGKESFCKAGFRVINKSLFTGWAVVLSHYQDRFSEINQNKRRIFKIYQEYLKSPDKDREFYNAITSSTGTKNHMVKSIGTIRLILEEFL